MLTYSVFFVISLIAVLRAIVAAIHDRRDLALATAGTDEENAPLSS